MLTDAWYWSTKLSWYYNTRYSNCILGSFFLVFFAITLTPLILCYGALKDGGKKIEKRKNLLPEREKVLNFCKFKPIKLPGRHNNYTVLIAISVWCGQNFFWWLCICLFANIRRLFDDTFYKTVDLPNFQQRRKKKKKRKADKRSGSSRRYPYHMTTQFWDKKKK